MNKVLFVLVLTVLLAGCTAGTSSIVKLPSPADRPKLPPEIPKYVPIYPGSFDDASDPLRVSNEHLGQSSTIQTIVGTRISNASPTYLFDWYKREFSDLGWAISYDMPYDEKYMVGQITSERFEEILTVTFEITTLGSKITYLCLKTPDGGK